LPSVERVVKIPETLKNGMYINADTVQICYKIGCENNCLQYQLALEIYFGYHLKKVIGKNLLALRLLANIEGGLSTI